VNAIIAILKITTFLQNSLSLTQHTPVLTYMRPYGSHVCACVRARVWYVCECLKRHMHAQVKKSGALHGVAHLQKR